MRRISDGPALLFEDNFDGPSLDSSKWEKFYYWGEDPPRNPGTGEIQTYTSTAHTFSSGVLSLNCDKMVGSETNEGPKTGSASADLGFGDTAGTTAWTNAGNATTSNNGYATVVRSSTGASNYIYISGFNFTAIPDGNTILGYKIEFECRSTAANTWYIGSSILVGPGINPSGDSFTNANLVVPTTEGFISIGGPTTLNNVTLTPAQVKTSDFGVALTVAKLSGATSQTFSLDSVRITVYTKAISYTSGMVNSYGHFSTQYGYFEARIKAPAGNGFWPAFWLLPTNTEWPPEIDIFEAGGAETFHYYVNSIYGDPGDPEGEDAYIDVNPTDGFHVYGLDWQPGYLRYYCDGVLVKETTLADAIPHETMYIIINLAVGPGGWSLVGKPDDTTVFPQSLDIDYVRVWATKP